MQRAIKVGTLAVMLSTMAFVATVYPYGQFMGNVSGVVVDEEWNLNQALSNRTPGDGRTVIVHFASGTASDRQVAIRAANDTWESITAVSFADNQAFQPSGAYNIGDGYNTHSFAVTLGGGGVLAFTPSVTNTSTGQILESDVYYNKVTKWDTSGNPSGPKVDVQSVAYHEIGHQVGLSHSGVSDATMFPYIQAGIASRSPEPDDNISPVLVYGRDAGDVAFAAGGISGRVIDGNDPNDGKLCALVFAFSAAEEPITTFDQAYAQVYSGSIVGASVSSNTTGPNSGYYQIDGLPNGDYMVFLVPTGDGLIDANQINNLCVSDAEADFPREFWNGAGESNNEADTFARVAVTVSGGQITTGIDFLTETGTGGCTTDPECDDGVACTDDACVGGSCQNTPNDANCPDDGLFCNGTEFCSSTSGCSSTGDPCPGGTTCNETTDTCDTGGCSPSGASCSQNSDCCSMKCKNGTCRG
ncbi:MAG: hypothetical protein C4523_15215 [Myxococcales bacterium]|nr:MAG: hypothetical protein C4523_15215 [Myxococcales bacterium]